MRRTKLEKLQIENNSVSLPRAWLPINLNRELLQDIFLRHWKHSEEFNIDKAIAICTLIIIKRYKVLLKDRGKMWRLGFSNIKSKQFIKWIGQKYKDYIQLLEVSGVIQVHNSYIPGGYPKAYKFTDYWISSDSDERRFKAEPYQDYNLELKAFRSKIANLESRQSMGERNGLFEYVKAVAAEFDVEGLTAYLLKKKLRSPIKLEEREFLIVQYNRLKVLDEVNVSPMDDFGRRFHSPFTNMKKEFRKFIRIDGELCEEIDLKNSQLFFFACICKFPEKVFKLLQNDWDDVIDLSAVIAFIKHEYQSNKDIQQFVERALEGSIYEYLQQNLDRDKVRSRSFIKDKVFTVLFSDESIAVVFREKLSVLFPTVVKVCNSLNRSGKKLAPLLLQRLESKLIIDQVSISAIDFQLGKFITIHDSFICASSKAESFKQHIIKIFTENGLPVPTLKSQKY